MFINVPFCLMFFFMWWHLYFVFSSYLWPGAGAFHVLLGSKFHFQIAFCIGGTEDNTLIQCSATIVTCNIITHTINTYSQSVSGFMVVGNKMAGCLSPWPISEPAKADMTEGVMASTRAAKPDQTRTPHLLTPWTSQCFSWSHHTSSWMSETLVAVGRVLWGIRAWRDLFSMI